MDQAQVIKREQEDWTKLYHKTLKGIEAIIDVQRMLKDMKKIAEDLWYLVQSDMDEWAFQVQRMLADELDHYKGKGNDYVDGNIKEIQELYMKRQ